MPQIGRFLVTVSCLAALGISASRLEAQRSWPPTWVQVGWAFSDAVGDWADVARNGDAWTGTVAFAYRPNLQLALEYSRQHFECERGVICTVGRGEWKVNGFRTHLEYRFAELSGLLPFVRAGVSLSQLRLESDLDFEGSYAVGLIGAAGFEVRMSQASSVLLSARGERFGSELPFLGDGHVQSWLVEFAFRYRVY